MTSPDPDYLPAGAHFASVAGADSSLAASSERWTQLSMASALAPHSVLQQLHPSPVAANLSAPSQQGRQLANGFVLSNAANGASAATASTENTLNMESGSE
jgi:hypothetical protein